MKIGFIAPYQDLIAMVEHVRQDNHTDVELIVKQATYTQAIREVRKMEAQGVEAIISRGATVAYIEQYTKLPVIRCDYGVADLLYALREAKKFSSRVGVITYASHAWMKSILEDLCQMDIFFLHGYKDEVENRQFVERLRRQGIDVIVGGIFSVELAEQFGMHGVLIPTRPETIALSVAESARVVRAIHKEREALEEIRQIINHVNDAILLAESEGNILMMNPSARALLRRLYRHGDVTSIFNFFLTENFVRMCRKVSTAPTRCGPWAACPSCSASPPSVQEGPEGVSSLFCRKYPKFKAWRSGFALSSAAPPGQPGTPSILFWARVLPPAGAGIWRCAMPVLTPPF